MAMGPMGGRGMRPAEKSKRGLRGVQRELIPKRSGSRC